MKLTIPWPFAMLGNVISGIQIVAKGGPVSNSSKILENNIAGLCKEV